MKALDFISFSSLFKSFYITEIKQQNLPKMIFLECHLYDFFHISHSKNKRFKRKSLSIKVSLLLLLGNANNNFLKCF